MAFDKFPHLPNRPKTSPNGKWLDFTGPNNQEFVAAFQEKTRHSSDSPQSGVSHIPPQEIFRKLAEIVEEIQQGMKELEEMLR
ncbi:MAG: hypothetical protein WEB60_03420 [Terrimicrobiaceae bacterium]